MPARQTPVEPPSTSSAAPAATTPMPMSSRGVTDATNRPTIGLATMPASAATPNRTPMAVLEARAPRWAGRTGSTAARTAAPMAMAVTMEADPGTRSTARGPAVSSVRRGEPGIRASSAARSTSATAVATRNGEAGPRASTRKPARGGPTSTPRVTVDMAMPIIWPRSSNPVAAAIRDRAATHAIPPARPCTKRAASSSQ